MVGMMRLAGFSVVFHGFRGSRCAVAELSDSVSVCREIGLLSVKVLKALTIQSIRFELVLVFDCFISLKKEKVAFLTFDAGSVVGRRSLERWSLWSESRELSKRGQSSVG